jgi:enoyl-CoA hydratase/carnithine racemase
MQSSDAGTLLCTTAGKVLVVTLHRPEALNAFDEAQFDAVTDVLLSASADPDTSVVLLTGAGRAFSVGLDKHDLAARGTGTFVEGRHGPSGLIQTLASFPKPLVVAVNGVAVGFGATLLALADVVLMSTDAREPGFHSPRSAWPPKRAAATPSLSLAVANEHPGHS